MCSRLWSKCFRKTLGSLTGRWRTVMYGEKTTSEGLGYNSCQTHNDYSKRRPTEPE